MAYGRAFDSTGGGGGSSSSDDEDDSSGNGAYSSSDSSSSESSSGGAYGSSSSDPFEDAGAGSDVIRNGQPGVNVDPDPVDEPQNDSGGAYGSSGGSGSESGSSGSSSNASSGASASSDPFENAGAGSDVIRNGSAGSSVEPDPVSEPEPVEEQPIGNSNVSSSPAPSDVSSDPFAGAGAGSDVIRNGEPGSSVDPDPVDEPQSDGDSSVSSGSGPNAESVSNLDEKVATAGAALTVLPQVGASVGAGIVERGQEFQDQYEEATADYSEDFAEFVGAQEFNQRYEEFTKRNKRTAATIGTGAIETYNRFEERQKEFDENTDITGGPPPIFSSVGTSPVGVVKGAGGYLKAARGVERGTITGTKVGTQSAKGGSTAGGVVSKIEEGVGVVEAAGLGVGGVVISELTGEEIESNGNEISIPDEQQNMEIDPADVGDRAELQPDSQVGGPELTVDVAEGTLDAGGDVTVAKTGATTINPGEYENGQVQPTQPITPDGIGHQEVENTENIREMYHEREFPTGGDAVINQSDVTDPAVDIVEEGPTGTGDYGSGTVPEFDPGIVTTPPSVAEPAPEPGTIPGDVSVPGVGDGSTSSPTTGGDVDVPTDTTPDSTPDTGPDTGPGTIPDTIPDVGNPTVTPPANPTVTPPGNPTVDLPEYGNPNEPGYPNNPGYPRPPSPPTPPRRPNLPEPSGGLKKKRKRKGSFDIESEKYVADVPTPEEIGALDIEAIGIDE